MLPAFNKILNFCYFRLQRSIFFLIIFTQIHIHLTLSCIINLARFWFISVFVESVFLTFIISLQVIITSVTSAKDASPPQQAYRLGQYPSGHSAYPYGYPTHYYHTPHHAPPYAHHDICYSPNAYLHKSYPYRRYLVAPPPSAQYFQTSPPDLYSAPPPAPPPSATQQNQQVGCKYVSNIVVVDLTGYSQQP